MPETYLFQVIWPTAIPFMKLQSLLFFRSISIFNTFLPFYVHSEKTRKREGIYGRLALYSFYFFVRQDCLKDCEGLFVLRLDFPHHSDTIPLLISCQICQFVRHKKSTQRETIQDENPYKMLFELGFTFITGTLAVISVAASQFRIQPKKYRKLADIKKYFYYFVMLSTPFLA